MKYVSCGEYGCWAIRKDDDSVCFRKGITEAAPQGQQWAPIPGRLRMLESGPSGVTVGINDDNDVFVRKGVVRDNPQGNEWVRLSIKLDHVTVGERGVIGVKEDSTVVVHQREYSSLLSYNLFKSLENNLRERNFLRDDRGIKPFLKTYKIIMLLI